MKASSTIEPGPLDQLLKSEFCGIVANQYSAILAPVLATQLLIAMCAYGHVPPAALLGWCAAVAAVHVARLTLLRRVITSTAIDLDRRVRTVVWMSVASGLVHAAAVSFLPFLPLHIQAVQYVLLLALCAGCVAVNVGHFGTVLGFVGPIVAALALFGASDLGGAPGTGEATGIAVLTVFFGMTLLYLSRDTYRTFARSVAIRLENAELARRLELALQGAEAASHSKTRFLASASHDLRQPLHTLSFLAAALELRPLDDKGREILRSMVRAVEDLASEFDMMLDISKLDAGVVTVSRGTFELAEFLGRVAGPFRAVAEARGLVFRIDAPSGIYVETDRGLLERIVRNLLDNAFKYTHAGAIGVKVRAKDGKCEIAVTDTGIGIPEGEKDRVFEEFYQVDNPERDRSKGLGLGLPIVKRLAGLLGIVLDMKSRPGSGTTFSLQLQAVPPPPAEKPVAASSNAALRDRQFLVIDDEADSRTSMQGYLEALGCQVATAATINEATALAHIQEPDLVVADFRLRGTETGLQAIEALRKTRPNLLALLLTGESAPEKLALMNASRIPILHKPVMPATLVKKIEEMLATT